MFFAKLPKMVQTRMFSRWLSKSCINMSQTEMRAWHKMVLRSPSFLQANQRLFLGQNGSRAFSTTRPIMDKKSDQDNEREKREAILKSIFLTALVTLIIMNLMRPSNSFPPEDPSGPRGPGGPPGGGPNNRIVMTWNEFFHNMLQAGEVEQIKISNANKVMTVKLVPGAKIKVNQLKLKSA